MTIKAKWNDTRKKYRVKSQNFFKFDRYYADKKTADGIAADINHGLEVLERFGITTMEVLDSASFKRIKKETVTDLILTKLCPVQMIDAIDPSVKEIMEVWREHLCTSDKVIPGSYIDYWRDDSSLRSKKLRTVTVAMLVEERKKLIKKPNANAGETGPISAKTVNNYLYQLQAAWSHHEILHMEQDPPSNKVKRLTTKKTSIGKIDDTTGRLKTMGYEPEEAGRLIPAAYKFDGIQLKKWGEDTKRRLFKYNGPLVHLIAETGIRNKFACNLNISDINDWDTAKPYVGKSMKWKVWTNAFLSDDAIDVLKGQWKIAEANNGYFFPLSKNRPVQQVPRENWRKIMKLAGVQRRKDIKPIHSFRGYTGARLLGRGLAPKYVADMLGISVETLLAHYAPVTEDQKDATIAALNATSLNINLNPLSLVPGTGRDA